jgi:flagellar basal-body rod protein FlgF
MKSVGLIASSQQHALHKQLEVISDNIANARTYGFKQKMLKFSQANVGNDPRGSTSLVKVSGVIQDTSSGHLRETGNTFDLALGDDDGYFTVETPAGPAYTRNGQFELGQGGLVVTGYGQKYPLLDDQGSPIAIPPGATEIAFQTDGSLYVNQELLCKIQPITFADHQAVSNIGESLCTSTQEPIPVDRPIVLQGRLEESNVNAIEEITRLIDVFRSYQASQSIIESDTQLQQQAISSMVKSNA